jgi:hypothetical protein
MSVMDEHRFQAKPQRLEAARATQIKSARVELVPFLVNFVTMKF